MKKILKSRIFIFVFGFALATGIGVYATSVSSSDVTYDNTNSGSEAITVEGAIDDLYSKIGNGGSLRLVTSGTGARTNGTVTVTPNVPKTLNNYIITMSELPAIGTASYAYNSSLILFGTAQPFMYLGEGYGFTGCSASSFNFRWNSNGTFNYYVYEINEE